MSFYEFNADYEADDYSDSADIFGQWTGKDATIFLIDIAPEMLINSDPVEGSYLRKAMKCVHATAIRKIISNDQDFYAVVLFNAKETKNSIDFPHIYVLQELDKPGAERILELETLLEDKNHQLLKDKYGSTSDTSIHDVLWVCRNLIIGCKSKLSTKNILLFTTQDNPHPNDEHKQRQAQKGAKDLKEAEIDIEILPLGNNFNMNLFYKELLSQVDDEESESLSTLADPTDRFEELLERVRKYDHKQRSTGRITFSLAPGVEMGVKIFTSIRKTYKPSKTKLYKVTNEEILYQRKEYLEDGELLMPSDFVKYQEFGRKKLKFNLDETRAMSKVYEPGIELLGFKKASFFSPYLYIKPASFIYPDEASVKGSKAVFASLLEGCLERDVCPVVRIVPRAGSSVAWAFLLPQKETKVNGCQEKPPGLHVCYLPFADDFRALELENRTRAQPDQVDMAKEVIKKLNFSYHPDCFENPDIQTHWRNIETLALNRAHLEEVHDYTVPDYSRMNKKAGRLIEAFKALVLPPSYDAAAVAKKRPPPKSEPVAKRTKPDISNISVEDMARQKKVEKLNMDALKQWLTARGIRVTGKKKAQLVQDVYDELQIDV